MELLERSCRGARGQLNYAQGDGSGVPVVLLHGITLDWRSMAEMGLAVSDVAQVYACDLPGHGRSDRVEGDYLISDYVDEISAFVRDVSGAGSVLVGYSLGALVALGVAAEVPDLVVGVAALEPPLITRNTDFEAISYSGAYAWIRWVDDVNGGKITASDAVDRFLTMNPGTSEADARQAMAEVAVVDPRATARVVSGRTFEGFRLEQVLETLSCPVLLVAGEVRLGGLVRDEDLAFFAAHTPRGRSVRVSDGGHEIIWDQTAAAVTTELVEWLRTLRAGRTSPDGVGRSTSVTW